MSAPSPNQFNVLTALRSFLLAVLPTTGPDGKPVSVIAAQQNRIAEPAGTSYVIMTPIRFERIETNIDSADDSKFTGSISGATMTVTAFDPNLNGPISVGSVIFGAGVANPTTVTALGSGTGGTGTYTVSPSQTVGSETLSAGQSRIQQNQKWFIQLDFHGDPANDISGDMSTTVSTLLRDAYGVSLFSGQSPDLGIRPLYGDDPRQTPFLNEEQQIENRWVLEAVLQANAVVTVPQQYADSATLGLADVNALFP